jgi:hypothetical protein
VEIPKKGHGSKSGDAVTRVHKNGTVRKKVDCLLAKKDFPAALDLIQQEGSRGVPESILEDEYLQALNGTLEQAENSMKEGHPGQAGILYRSALAGLPLDEAQVRRTRLSFPEIQAKIENCANLLMEKGLMAYRRYLTNHEK